MNKFNAFLGLVFGLFILFSSNVLAEESFIVTDDVFVAREVIENAGGKVNHLFPNEGVIIGDIPDNFRLKGVKIYDKKSRLDNQLFNVWSDDSKNKKINVGSLYNDYIIEETNTNLLRYVPNSIPQEALPTDTSLYMIGDVSVSVILPESIGSSEDWTSAEISKVYSEILDGLDWYIQREPNARLTFVYNFEEQVPVTMEPIENRRGYGVYWINEVMDELGFGAPGDVIPPTPLVYDYVNYQRDTKNTDWGFAVFVVDSSNDVDGLFSDGYSAFSVGSSSGGGPYMVMTYDNGGYTVDSMDAVMAHETGHMFGAADQYFGCSPTTTRGYLYVENQNCVNGGIIDELSIMKNPLPAYGAGALDIYARGQIGWMDSDGDGVLDIIDLEPSVKVTSCDGFRGMVTCSGNAEIKMFETLNPNYNNAMINRIDSVMYKTYSGTVSDWFNIDYFSDSSNDYFVDFKFDIPLKVGLDVKVVDRFGLETAVENYGHIPLEESSFYIEERRPFLM